ncbi:helix-turn-helix transcriptional regulator [Nocardia terpenica]|uniref:Transcriptional regulator n=1 Tax=Nocardia terpenica TaxID=455432 RepID=A0A291RNL3_9NOCA|nr:helix-turn-helix transcriptional regulator [Nocardia terpenica]ATL68702.1 transcriptional regulator [Nocardia terpenica]
MTELGEFLRAKRAALSPERAGIDTAGRVRRVPGLRRDEVAMLADVGVDHYTRLEQGRASGVSEAVVAGIARALQLTADEHTYLLALANPKVSPRRTARRPSAARVAAPTRVLLDGLTGMPALVMDRRMDILAWNQLATELFVDFAELPAAERNMVRLLFLDPRVRSRYRDWAAVAADAVARVRTTAAEYPDDTRLTTLIGELSIRDADFRRWWGGRAVRPAESGRKIFAHPTAGDLELDWQALRFTNCADQTLIVYTAAPGSPTEQAIQFLQSWNATPHR